MPSVGKSQPEQEIIKISSASWGEVEKGGGRRPSPARHTDEGGCSIALAMGQSPAVGPDVLQFSEAEPLIRADAHRHVERAKEFELHFI